VEYSQCSRHQEGTDAYERSAAKTFQERGYLGQSQALEVKAAAYGGKRTNTIRRFTAFSVEDTVTLITRGEI
jgi:hypothetical protein